MIQSAGRLEVCVREGLNRDYADDFLQREILADFLLTDVDRHMRNIEILRDPDTLQAVSMAPMYDFGNSMFFRCFQREDLPDREELAKVQTHSFNNHESRLLKHVTRFCQFDVSRLKDRELFDSVYGKDQTKSRDFYDGVYRIYCYKIDLAEGYLKNIELRENT